MEVQKSELSIMISTRTSGKVRSDISQDSRSESGYWTEFMHVRVLLNLEIAFFRP